MTYKLSIDKELLAEIDLLKQEISLIRTHLELQENLLESIRSRVENIDIEYEKEIAAIIERSWSDKE